MDLVDQIIQVESGGNPNAQNPNSSAGGLGQFTNSTWLNTIKAHRPDLAQQYSTSDLLRMKTDPALSREMTGHYVNDNAAYLRSRGIDPTPGNIYLAHFAGPGGAASILGAKSDTPLGSVMSPAAVKANPFLRNMTVGDLQQWATRKMGGAGAPAAPAVPGAPASPSTMTAQMPVANPDAAAMAPAGAPTDAAASQFQGGQQQMAMNLMRPQQQPAPQAIPIPAPEPPGAARIRELIRAMAQAPLKVTGEEQA